MSSKTVNSLDLVKFMGPWNEIAHYPFKYQQDCEKAKAIYKLDGDKILVTNQCYAGGKMLRERTATAWVPDPSEPGKLKIIFNGFPRDTTPGDYWVRWTDYNDAIVSDSTGNSLWWLSRNPTVRARDVEPMLKLIRTFGYNTDKLITHPSIVTK